MKVATTTPLWFWEDGEIASIVMFDIPDHYCDPDIFVIFW